LEETVENHWNLNQVTTVYFAQPQDNGHLSGMFTFRFFFEQTFIFSKSVSINPIISFDLFRCRLHDLHHDKLLHEEEVGYPSVWHMLYASEEVSAADFLSQHDWPMCR
jgi:hypothetical protein